MARQLGNDNSESLVQTAWFYLMLYFGRRGRENQRNMVKEEIVFRKTANGLEYIALRERATKNHPGGFRDNVDNSRAIMYERPYNTETSTVRCIKKYLQKRNPSCSPYGKGQETTAPANLMKATRCGTAMSL